MTKIHFVTKLYIKKSKFDTFKFIIFNDYQHLFDSAELIGKEEDEGRVCGLKIYSRSRDSQRFWLYFYGLTLIYWCYLNNDAISLNHPSGSRMRYRCQRTGHPQHLTLSHVTKGSPHCVSFVIKWKIGCKCHWTQWWMCFSGWIWGPRGQEEPLKVTVPGF